MFADPCDFRVGVDWAAAVCHSESKDLVEQRSLAGCLEHIGDIFICRWDKLESGETRWTLWGLGLVTMLLEVKEDRDTDKHKRHLCDPLARWVIIVYQEMWPLKATQVEPRATSKDLTVLRVGQFHPEISMYNIIHILVIIIIVYSLHFGLSILSSNWSHFPFRYVLELLLIQLIYLWYTYNCSIY